MNEANVAGARPLSQFLRMAVMAGVESAVQIHIDRGDDLNARDAGGMTPLMLSAARNKPSICKLLLGAGADHGLLDPSGKTALEIAIAAGSQATAEILRAVFVPPPSSPEPKLPLDPEPEAAAVPVPSSDSVDTAVTLGEHDEVAAPLEPETAIEPPAPEPIESPPVVVDEADDGEFDLSGWEAEEEPTRPEADLVVVDSASAVQVAITAHEPIDSSAEWDDIDAYLPEVALPLARADDAEGRARLRLLLLRALREGSVPALDVQAQSTNEDRSANPEAQAYLTMVINDLGAEVDERFEYFDAAESFEVFVDPDETPDEETAVNEALSAIDRAASPHHEPLRIYQREFQRLRLLTAEEEVRLAKDMEAALEVALDALAGWPDGIARTLAAGAEAIAGSRQLSSMWVGDEPEPELPTTESLEASTPAQAESAEALDDDVEPAKVASADDSAADFANALRRLAVLVETDGAPGAAPQELRQALASLRLDRRFLLELIDAAHGLAPCPAFALAMAGFRQHRDRMAAANLKLAFFHAKKYLYSGEPLDDLAQEGNIGLLKAVDRYDWRRGFRFSTYATWWIRQQIGRHVADKARTIRVPVHIFEKLQRAERMARAFEAAAGREPSLIELAERVEMPPHKLAALLRIAPEPSGIDELTVDGMVAIDARDAILPPDPADVVEAAELRAAIEGMLSSLSNKDEQIIRLRFGIGVDEALTLEEVGQRYAVTRERIRQIETKALRKLKHPSRVEPFARLALGIQPSTDRRKPAQDETDDSADDDTAELLVEALKQQDTRPSVADSPPRSSKSSRLARVLEQAAELGIRVDDERMESGRIWVNLLDTPEKTHRRLARRLLELGFVFWPGKGYWR